MARLTTAILAALALTSAAAIGDVMVPLPAGKNLTLAANDAYAEVLLQNLSEQALTLPGGPTLAPGQAVNNVGIGYTLDDGTGQRAFVLYTGGLATTGGVTKPNQALLYDPTGSTISAIFSGQQGTVGRLFLVGRILAIRDSNAPTTGSELYSRGPGDPNPNPQLNFTFYNAHMTGLHLSPVILNANQAGVITAFFELSGDQGREVHLDIYADPTPDADVGPLDPAGQRYAPVSPTADSSSGQARPELPVRGPAPVPGMVGDQPGQLYLGLDDGTYYDRSSAGVWRDMAFAGDPADDDEVMWSFVGNAGQVFATEQRFLVNAPAAESFTTTRRVEEDGQEVLKQVEVFIAGSSRLMPEVAFLGTLVPGESLSPKAQLQPGLGYQGGFLNHLLVAGGDYSVSGSLLFGGSLTGAYDSDPNTFTFQELPSGANTLLQLSGPVTPEPTVLLLLLGGAVLILFKRRRSAPAGAGP